MRRRMPAAELVEWRAYERIEPFGERRADLRMGILAATVVNVNLPKGRPRAKPAAFMPKFLSVDEQRAARRAKEMATRDALRAHLTRLRDEGKVR